jgi:homoserine dehydrogenase
MRNRLSELTATVQDVSVVQLGILGCGTVGAELLALLDRQGTGIQARTGLEFAVAGVAVRDVGKSRPVALADGVLTDDARSLVARPDVDVVVELIGGVEPARSLVLEALQAGKPVVTANKELLAAVGAELFSAADAAGVDLVFEAAVAGGIPLVRPLRESLAGEDVRRVMGIVNGTTNYMLTRMTEEGASYADALAEAQALGYAESDPSADVEGSDAAAKAAIIASIAFGTEVVAEDVHCEGITELTPIDIAFASRLGYVVKLLAIVERSIDGGVAQVAARVHPAMVPETHPLASVRESFNAVFVEGAAVGELMFYGRGAGGGPTASAVLGDVIDAASNLRRGSHASIGTLTRVPIRSIDDLVSEYYINLEVADRPGVLAQVADVFGRNAVSIRSMEQEGLGEGARLIFITHLACERDVRRTLSRLGELDVVRSVGSVIRVAGEDDAAGG